MAAEPVHGFTTDAARRLPGPDWLTARRVAAAERFAATSTPTAADEEWRYSPIADFDLGRYRLPAGLVPDAPHASGDVSGSGSAGGMVSGSGSAGGASPGRGPDSGFVGRGVSDSGSSLGLGLGLVCGGGGSAGRERVPGLDGSGSSGGFDDPTGGAAAAVVEVADGRVVAARGLEALAARGVVVGPLAQAPDGEELLGSVCDAASDYFTVLNDAFALTPLVVDVPAGVILGGPVVIRHHACAPGGASLPRLVVRLGAGAQATVLDVQRSSGEALVVPVVELDVGQGARLGYLNFQQHDQRAWQFAAHTARVGRDGALVAASVALGGAYARTRADTRLVGRGACGDLLSAYFGSGDQILDFRTFQDHAAPDTTSNLLYKGAVGGSARSVYTGLIRVRPDARGTNAFQTNRNIKLSDGAWAESVPNLEIENNDVRCSHASTVGPVDPDQVFYLESRGVPTAAAERLIVSGFFDEVIDALPVAAMTRRVRQALNLKLDLTLSLEAHASETPSPMPAHASADGVPQAPASAGAELIDEHDEHETGAGAAHALAPEIGGVT